MAVAQAQVYRIFIFPVAALRQHLGMEDLESVQVHMVPHLQSISREVLSMHLPRRERRLAVRRRIIIMKNCIC